MKVELKGVGFYDFQNDKGERVFGTSLHVVGLDKEQSKSMNGFRVAKINTGIELGNLVVGNKYDLVYETPLGGKTARLVGVNPL